MDLKEFKSTLVNASEKSLQIVLPDGTEIPKHFHVTEIGQVRKDFVDCGGEKRTSTSCVIQIWVATDVDHRVSCDKFLKILGLADDLLVGDFLPVEIEYQHGVISQFPVESIEAIQQEGENVLRINLGSKFTDCLAKDKCGIPEDDPSRSSEDSCCSGLSGCC